MNHLHRSQIVLSTHDQSFSPQERYYSYDRGSKPNNHFSSFFNSSSIERLQELLKNIHQRQLLQKSHLGLEQKLIKRCQQSTSPDNSSSEICDTLQRCIQYSIQQYTNKSEQYRKLLEQTKQLQEYILKYKQHTQQIARRNSQLEDQLQICEKDRRSMQERFLLLENEIYLLKKNYDIALMEFEKQKVDNLEHVQHIMTEVSEIKDLQVGQLGRTVSQLQSEIEGSQKRIGELQGQRELHMKQIKDCKVQIMELNHENQRLRLEMKSMTNKVYQLQKQQHLGSMFPRSDKFLEFQKKCSLRKEKQIQANEIRSRELIKEQPGQQKRKEGVKAGQKKIQSKDNIKDEGKSKNLNIINRIRKLSTNSVIIDKDKQKVAQKKLIEQERIYENFTILPKNIIRKSYHFQTNINLEQKQPEQNLQRSASGLDRFIQNDDVYSVEESSTENKEAEKNLKPKKKQSALKLSHIIGLGSKQQNDKQKMKQLNYQDDIKQESNYEIRQEQGFQQTKRQKQLYKVKSIGKFSEMSSNMNQIQNEKDEYSINNFSQYLQKLRQTQRYYIYQNDGPRTQVKNMKSIGLMTEENETETERFHEPQTPINRLFQKPRAFNLAQSVVLNFEKNDSSKKEKIDINSLGRKNLATSMYQTRSNSRQKQKSNQDQSSYWIHKMVKKIVSRRTHKKKLNLSIEQEEKKKKDEQENRNVLSKSFVAAYNTLKGSFVGQERKNEEEAQKKKYLSTSMVNLKSHSYLAQPLKEQAKLISMKKKDRKQQVVSGPTENKFLTSLFNFTVKKRIKRN